MNTYTIYIKNNAIATISDTEACYACYEAAKTIAEMTCQTASLVWDATGKVIAFYDPKEEDYEESADIDDDCGFDPYEGCYTYDC